ncbi:MAG TPA: 50S ribosomal protein L11 methyltransferase [Anaeromyxobacteraceae bacterium]|nr:50S ribosomal protein L11 methyltransferase [Anaeromyxobacteraceae bacterium]
MSRPLAELVEFVRARTAPAPVPLVPELSLYTASELTPLWRATSAELRGWDPSPYWAFPWVGGQALARFLLDYPEVARGRSVFDFAAGSGLGAIAAMKAGASRAEAGDLDPVCQAAVWLNAGLNAVQVGFRAGDAIGDPLDGFDLVLAGDVFYERPLAEKALAWFRSLAGRGARVLAGDPGRLYSPQAGMRDLASYDVPTTREIESRPVMRTWVLEVVGRQDGEGVSP